MLPFGSNQLSRSNRLNNDEDEQTQMFNSKLQPNLNSTVINNGNMFSETYNRDDDDVQATLVTVTDQRVAGFINDTNSDSGQLLMDGMQ